LWAHPACLSRASDSVGTALILARRQRRYSLLNLGYTHDHGSERNRLSTVKNFCSAGDSSDGLCDSRATKCSLAYSAGRDRPEFDLGLSKVLHQHDVRVFELVLTVEKRSAVRGDSQASVE